MKTAHIFIAALAAFCATAIATETQVAFAYPKADDVVYFGAKAVKNTKTAPAKKETEDADTSKGDSDEKTDAVAPAADDATDAEDDTAPAAAADDDHFIYVQATVQGKLPSTLKIVLERKSTFRGWRAFSDPVPVPAAKLTDGTKIHLNNVDIKDGKYRVVLKGIVPRFLGMGSKSKTLATGAPFMIRTVGRVASKVPDEYQVIDGADFGDGQMTVHFAKGTPGYAGVRYSVINAQTLKEVDGGIVKPTAGGQHDVGKNIDQEKLVATGKYFVEFKIRHWRRAWLKRETFYRTEPFTVKQLKAVSGGSDEAESDGTEKPDDKADAATNNADAAEATGNRGEPAESAPEQGDAEEGADGESDDTNATTSDVPINEADADFARNQQERKSWRQLMAEIKAFNVEANLAAVPKIED